MSTGKKLVDMSPALGMGHSSLGSGPGAMSTIAFGPHTLHAHWNGESQPSWRGQKQSLRLIVAPQRFPRNDFRQPRPAIVDKPLGAGGKFHLNTAVAVLAHHMTTKQHLVTDCGLWRRTARCVVFHGLTPALIPGVDERMRKINRLCVWSGQPAPLDLAGRGGVVFPVCSVSGSGNDGPLSRSR